jgi:hypothetical protein
MAQSSTADMLNSKMTDYTQLKTIPSVLSIAFAIASLFAFGGIASVELSWIGYTLTADHSIMLSLGVYAAAFASSETRQFSNYSQAEQALIALAPALLIGNYLGIVVPGLISSHGQLAEMAMFVGCLAGWGVAVQ